MFYGQLLGNRIEEEVLNSKYKGNGKIIKSLTPEQRAQCIQNATEQDSESLARLIVFLGEEGILKNDDIFGEGFFMGLEVMYTIAEEIGELYNLQKIFQIYKNISEKWNKKDIDRYYKYIKAFVSNIRWRDNFITDRVVNLLPATTVLPEVGTRRVIERMLEGGIDKIFNINVLVS